MRRTSRPPAFALTLVLVALAAFGCGAKGSGGSEGGGEPIVIGDVSPDTTPPGPSTSERPSVGELPAAVDGDPAVSLRTCALDPEDRDRVLVEALVVNATDGPQLLQGLPVTITDQDGAVVSADAAELWSSITIGPGRQALHRGDVDLDGPVRSVTCELASPDLRPERLGGGHEIDPSDLELTGCSPLTATVRNRSDRPVGVTVQVEAFDDHGNSAGTFELGQHPKRYTDGHRPSPTEVALPAGETGEYSVDPNERIDDYGTPLDGAITSCEVVATALVSDPEPVEIIVD